MMTVDCMSASFIPTYLMISFVCMVTIIVISEINEHFGSEVALYLSFMDHFIYWLAPPAVFGLLIATMNHLDPDMDVNNNLMVPLFSVFVIIWAILFVQTFKQTCSGLVRVLYCSLCRWFTGRCMLACITLNSV